ncbi:hypothetical protein [uncultured Nostoc sp.]|uniref:hypothetical protein n=1 Tax=uncultured Nostoc sp. TaxID=340711 RepID=UPI0035CA4113
MKNSTHSWDGVFGHGEEVTNALYPMPEAAGRLSLSIPRVGWRGTAAFINNRE